MFLVNENHCVRQGFSGTSIHDFSQGLQCYLCLIKNYPASIGQGKHKVIILDNNDQLSNFSQNVTVF